MCVHMRSRAHIDEGGYFHGAIPPGIQVEENAHSELQVVFYQKKRSGKLVGVVPKSLASAPSNQEMKQQLGEERITQGIDHFSANFAAVQCMNRGSLEWT